MLDRLEFAFAVVAVGLFGLLTAPIRLAEEAVTSWRQLHRAAARRGNRAITDALRLVGAGLIMALVITLVLTEVYDAINITSSSPFYGIVTALEGTGVSAMVLIVVGFLVIAASALMRYFNFGTGGGR